MPTATPLPDLLPVFHALPGAHLLLSPDLCILAASDDYLVLTLTRRDMLVGQHLFDAFPDSRSTAEANGVANLRASLARVLNTGQPHDIAPQRYDVPDPAHPGQLVERHAQPRNTPVLDAAGQVQCIVHSVTDITADYLVERQLRESRADEQAARVEAAAQRRARELFHQIFEQTPALVALLRDPGHRVEYVNPAYQRLFPGRQLTGLDIGVAVPELRAQGFIDLLDRVYQTGETYVGQELPFVADLPGSPGSAAYFNFTYQAYREEGRITGISIFAYDVTEQARARQERETRQRQLQEVFAQAPVAICVFRGPEYVLDVVNPPMAEMLGRGPAQLLGQPFFAALPELAIQGLRELLDGVRLTGQPFVAQEQEIHLVRHGLGNTGFYNFVYQPLRDPQGQIGAITCVATDVTEQVRARQQVQELNAELATTNAELQVTNEELSAANTQLMRTNADLDTFIYTASHDLKTPIANIEGLLAFLREELSPSVAQNEYVGPTLARMQGAVERFQRTIEHLTDIIKLQKEHAPVSTAVHLTTVLDDVQQDLAPLLAQTGAQLRVDVGELPPVQFSEKDLRSVVYNLLSNALKYRSPDRPLLVDVRAREQSGYTVLEVRDNGLGIAPAYLPKLFALFQRFHPHIEGTGIGLYMVKRMVENAGGRIEVQSQPGTGTSFFVHLPPAARIHT